MIFYFSGTGNTRWAAETLAQATGERQLFIPDELKGDTTYALAEDERIGFCFPVHGWQPPHIVRLFVKRLVLTTAAPSLRQHYCYAVCTCGDNVGQTMDIFNSELRTIGLETNSVLSLVMPESYVCLPFMYTDTPEKEQRKIVAARERLEVFCQQVCRREKGIQELVKGATPRLYSYVIGEYFNKRMITDRKFTVDGDVCIHCGKCAQVCPVGDIEFDETPSWKNDSSCTCCLSCYHHCPVHAINYGKITRKRGQYYFGH